MQTLPQRAATPAAKPSIRLVGIGNTGVSVIDRIFLARFGASACSVINTDSRSLTAAVTEDKILLGPQSTRGLGAGGDPELATNAWDESAGSLAELAASADVFFLLGGLGGGTGSACLPRTAAFLRHHGKTVFVLVSLPFEFEGKRRQQQANHALEALQQHADLILTFDNNRLSEVVHSSTPVAEAFLASDQILEQAVTSLSSMLEGEGPAQITASDLIQYLRAHDPCALFGAGHATGSNRAHEAVARALKSPLLQKGRSLFEATSVMVHLSGQADLSYAEVQAALAEVQRFVEDDAAFSFGISTAAAVQSGLTVTILAVTNRIARASAVETPVRVPQPEPEPVDLEPEVETHQPEELVEPESPVAASTPEPLDVPPPGPASSSASEPAPPRDQSELFRAGDIPVVEKSGAAASPRKDPPKPKQETLQFEPVSKGRFDKSEPTIIEGEDLDVPTFLRRKTRLR